MSVITIVTGLPRSGTSLMMQILEKVPIEIMTDNQRQKDENNPEGYYELEAVKGIVRNNDFLKSAQGKVLKVVAPLPQFLDLNLSYRVIFMRRDMEEILRSQEKMLKKDQVSEREKFRAIYELHLKKTYQFFLMHQIPYVDVSYANLVQEPETEISKLIDFLKVDKSSIDLVNCIKKELYRNKAT
jgi:hypothetical protein